MAGRLLTPLDFVSDADLAEDFLIQRNGLAVDLTGYGVSLVFAITTGGGFALSVGQGIVAPGPEGRIRARVAASEMSDKAGAYDACELRLLAPDGSDVAWLLFSSRIATGASEIVAGAPPVATGPVGTGAETITIDWTDGGIVVDSTPGVAGDGGWSPMLAVVSDGARNVMKLVGWTGGQGPPPASNLYLGASGYVADIHQAATVGAATALQVSFDPAASGLNVTTVQGAVDLLAEMFAVLSEKVLPIGGLAGQVLAKQSNANFDTEWISLDPVSSPGQLDFSNPDDSGLIGH